MDFKDQIKQLGERVVKLKDQILTEEATKNAFIMPFLQCLGYDVFNPLEVVPEYVTDIGTKKGEKVDYAIFKDGMPMILIECKHWAQKLDIHDGQLLRYFHVSKAKFAILTNGVKFRFYTDLVEQNKMDEKPFLEIDITDVKDNQAEELKKFHKSYFDVQTIITSANELKYTGEIKSLFINELKSPSEQFVKFFTAQVYSGRVTEKVVNQFTELVRKSVQQVISDQITDRLKSALDKEAENAVSVQQPASAESSGSPAEAAVQKENKVETTSEELEAFFIVKSILRSRVEASRIGYRDAQNYFTVILDDSNRKPICRMYLNGNKRMIGVFDEGKNETKHEITSLDDVFSFSERLSAMIELYEQKKA